MKIIVHVVRVQTANMSIDKSRVTLRGFNTDDLAGFLGWATDDEVTKWLMWDSYTSEQDALNYLQDVAIPHPWIKAICVDGEAAGSMQVEPGTGYDACRGVMGYCLARNYWGMGVAIIAGKQMLALVFQGMDIARMEAVVIQDNIASRRVLEKADFKLEGAMRKYLLIKGKKLTDCFSLATYAPDHAVNPPPS